MPILTDVIKNTLSQSQLKAVYALPEEQSAYFVEEFSKKMKNKTLMLVLAILFPIQLFFVGKVGLGIAFLLTSGGCGIWYIIEIFLTFNRVKEYNQELATKIIQDIKTLHN